MYAFTFLANCGILLDTGSEKLLIDGLYRCPESIVRADTGHRIPAEETIQAILHRQGLFSDVTRLLFTHRHWDHCDLSLAEEYHRMHGIPLLFPADDGQDDCLDTASCRIERIHTIHDMMTNPDRQPHCCYRITAGGKTLVFTGDSDVHHPLPASLYAQPVDALFLNVHHILVPEGRTAVTEQFRPAHLYIQHLPDPACDRFGLNRRIANKLKVYGETLPPYTLLDTPMTTYEIAE